MKGIEFFVLGSALFAIIVPCGADAQDSAPVIKPLRGDVPVLESTPADVYRMERHDRIVPRDFVSRPPVIPHNIKGYQITRNVNMCMACHASSRSADSGAPKPSFMHYLDRDGRPLENVSARRYFCLQCHAPQTDAEPLVPNTYQKSSR